MRKYIGESTIELNEVICNRCGRRIETKSGHLIEGVAQVEIHWGYESNKDGEIHKMDLCEECYNEMIDAFALPVEIEEKAELL